MSEFVVVKPLDMQFKLTKTLSLEDWKKLSKQFKQNSGGYVEWPASDFVVDIINMVEQAERRFYPEKGDRK